MDYFPPLASFFWDPPREAFTIPFIGWPVFWYGILFVTGFVLGYFVINPFLVNFLNRSYHISEIDILDWPLFIKNLQNSDSSLALLIQKHLSQPTRKTLLTDNHQLPSVLPNFQKQLLAEINEFLKKTSYSREQVAPLFGKALASSKQTAYFLGDRLCWFVITGTVIGARLGEVFFYNWPYYSAHPMEILKTWEGGLASHGGVLGVIIALFLYWKYIQQWLPELTFLRLLDFVAVPSALAATFIRLGNFMNQEILGTPTSMPWGVLFGHPEGGAVQVVRHPVQLYEAFAYLVTFFILWRNEKKEINSPQTGGTIGLLFILIFGSRFILEFWKAFQASSLGSLPFLQMGQLLSLPFILVGFLLWQRAKKGTLSCK